MALAEAIAARTLAECPSLGSRFYPDIMPEKVTYPAGRFQLISSPDVASAHDNTGPAGMYRDRYQFDVWTAGAIEARDVGDELVTAWENFKGTVLGVEFGRVIRASRMGGYDDAAKKFRQTIDFFIWYKTL